MERIGWLSSWLHRFFRVDADCAPALDATPADGLVEIAPLEGTLGAPNLSDCRFVRFTALGDQSRAGISRTSPLRRGRAPLLGRVLVLSLFIGRDNRTWTDEEIGQAQRACERACQWIERQAMRFGAAVSFSLAGTYFVADDHSEEEVAIDFVPEGEEMGPHTIGELTSSLASASRAARSLGFPDMSALAGTVGALAPADHRVWMLFPKRAGRSGALSSEDTGLPGVDAALCYAREASFPEPLVGPPFTDPITIVHELLHLFGAEDKYGVPLSKYPKGTVSERDIMYLYYESLSRLRVDNLTAVELGWNPRLPESGEKRRG